jgi:hypothetical protein
MTDPSGLGVAHDEAKIRAAGCTVLNGIVTNANGYNVCGVLNQHDKPCQRIGRCPFHGTFPLAAISAHAVQALVDTGAGSGTGAPIDSGPSDCAGAATMGELGVGERTHHQVASYVSSPSWPGCRDVMASHTVGSVSDNNPTNSDELDGGASSGSPHHPGSDKPGATHMPPRPAGNKVPYKKGWSKHEHLMFLLGLERHGRGSWKQISAIVRSRTPTQIQSHAQKFFLRKEQQNKNKRSIHDFDLQSPEMLDLAAQINQVPPIDDGGEGRGIDVNSLPVADVATSNNLLPSHVQPVHVNAQSSIAGPDRHSTSMSEDLPQLIRVEDQDIRHKQHHESLPSRPSFANTFNPQLQMQRNERNMQNQQELKQQRNQNQQQTHHHHQLQQQLQQRQQKQRQQQQRQQQQRQQQQQKQQRQKRQQQKQQQQKQQQKQYHHQNVENEQEHRQEQILRKQIHGQIPPQRQQKQQQHSEQQHQAQQHHEQRHHEQLQQEQQHSQIHVHQQMHQQYRQQHQEEGNNQIDRPRILSAQQEPQHQDDLTTQQQLLQQPASLGYDSHCQYHNPTASSKLYQAALSPASEQSAPPFSNLPPLSAQHPFHAVAPLSAPLPGLSCKPHHSFRNTILIQTQSQPQPSPLPSIAPDTTHGFHEGDTNSAGRITHTSPHLTSNTGTLASPESGLAYRGGGVSGSTLSLGGNLGATIAPTAIPKSASGDRNEAAEYGCGRGISGDGAGSSFPVGTGIQGVSHAAAPFPFTGTIDAPAVATGMGMPEAMQSAGITTWPRQSGYLHPVQQLHFPQQQHQQPQHQFLTSPRSVPSRPGVTGESPFHQQQLQFLHGSRYQAQGIPLSTGDVYNNSQAMQPVYQQPPQQHHVFNPAPLSDDPMSSTGRTVTPSPQPHVGVPGASSYPSPMVLVSEDRQWNTNKPVDHDQHSSDMQVPHQLGGPEMHNVFDGDGAVSGMNEAEMIESQSHGVYATPRDMHVTSITEMAAQLTRREEHPLSHSQSHGLTDAAAQHAVPSQPHNQSHYTGFADGITNQAPLPSLPPPPPYQHQGPHT